MGRVSNFTYWSRFIIIAGIFLFGWFIFWEVKHQGWLRLADFSSVLPVPAEERSDIEALSLIANRLMDTKGETKTFLILFQNNLELRPGGGFIGSFGILKIRDGNVVEFSTHDTGNFDGRIPSTVAPPYPMKDLLHIDSWKLRDSNFSPDFPTNANEAVRFYTMGDGQEKFDGVIGVTAEVLSSLLDITGPVTVDGFPGTYGSDNAILDLEYQVEKGYADQNIKFGERKSVLKLLGDVVLKKVKTLSISKKYELFTVLLSDLHRKDIQIHFNDEDLQSIVADAGWSGAIDPRWKDDSFMLVDANLGALKSDYRMERRIEYLVDLSGESAPKATLKMIYRHTGTARDWYTKDYVSYLRAYIPEGSYVTRVENGDKPIYGSELGKKFVGVIVGVPLASEKTVTFEYTLPDSINYDWYDLKIMKQPGTKDIPTSITVIGKDGNIKNWNTTLDRDFILSERGS